MKRIILVFTLISMFCLAIGCKDKIRKRSKPSSEEITKLNSKLISELDRLNSCYTTSYMEDHAIEVFFKNNIKMLMDRGADIDAKDQYGVTYMHKAIQSFANTFKTIKFLVENGADINAQDSAWGSPLCHAVTNHKNIRIVEYLIGKGADINVKGRADNTPLHYAINCMMNFEIILYLIENGAKLNVKNSDGNTPLHLASVCSKYMGLVKILVEKGANINAKDNNEQKPVDLAEGEIKEYLKSLE